MIHQLLNLTRPLFVLDTETTGLNTETARIVEIGFERWTAEGMVKEWRTLVNPGVPIPVAVTAIHSITDAMVQGCKLCQPAQVIGPQQHGAFLGVQEHEFAPWPTFKQLAANLALGFQDCDFAGKNVRFDLRILASEMKRAKQPWSYAGARVIDADRLEQIAVPRTLSDLYRKYAGHELEGAHGALSDVRGSTTVIVSQLEIHSVLPRDLDQLHELSWPGWLSSDGGFRIVNGVPTIMFGKHRDKAMKDVPRDYWDWLLSADFGEDAKKLARDAKLGKYPEAKK